VSKPTIRQQEIQRLEELLEFYKTHLTLEDLAKRYGVTIHTVSMWRTRNPDFPKPSERRISSGGFKGASTLRRATDVDEWLATKRREKPSFGKPRKIKNE
jgi:transcriptional regulator with XRE-family HTH domain